VQRQSRIFGRPANDILRFHCFARAAGNTVRIGIEKAIAADRMVWETAPESCTHSHRLGSTCASPSAVRLAPQIAGLTGVFASWFKISVSALPRLRSLSLED
jgi:hypothetical protein